MQVDESDNLGVWEQKFAAFINREGDADGAHDLAHIQRVVANARNLAAVENANLAVIVPAAWLHDCVILPKNSKQRSQASRLAAEKAGDFLSEVNYQPDLIPAIQHAIEAHSFSAKIIPVTLEAEIIQDADRLDAIGAVGIARCFLVGGFLGTRLYDPNEPFPDSRQPDDRLNIIDHFYVKLLRLVESMKTAAGIIEAERRTEFMRLYLQEFRREILAG